MKNLILSLLLVPLLAGGMSLDDAVNEARRHGRVLGARVIEEGGKPVYRIKILTPRGEVRYLEIPPRERPKRRPWR